MNSFSAARSIFGLALRTRGFLSGCGGGAAFYDGGVFALVSVAGIEEAGVEAGLVAEEEEPLGIGVEATEGIDVRG